MVTVTSFPTTVLAVLVTDAFICARTLTKTTPSAASAFAVTFTLALVDIVVAEVEENLMVIVCWVVF